VEVERSGGGGGVEVELHTGSEVEAIRHGGTGVEAKRD